MIEIWQADLASPTWDDARLCELLSAGEIAQARRYHFESDRTRFVRRRAFRRLWLSHRLERPPESLRFVAGPQGKPSLHGVADDIRFNCSASGDQALLGFSMSGEVGVDVEQHRPMDADLALVIERFSTDERRALDGQSAAVRPRMFFECWARKEAFVKAVGCGLSLPLDAFAVPLTPGAVAAAVRWTDDPVAGRRWWVTSLDVGPGASAAVAADQPSPVQRYSWSWPP